MDHLKGPSIQEGHKMYALHHQQASYPEPPKVEGVLSLTERAHMAFELLQNEILRLGTILDPVRSIMPSKDGCSGNQCLGNSEPQALTGLRALVDRIEYQTSVVRQIADELRI